jgi:hypothetical protein
MGEFNKNVHFYLTFHLRLNMDFDVKVAAATDRRNLRLFSVGGLQRHVIALPGPIVALAGNGPHIFVTVHSGLPLPGDQVLYFNCFVIPISFTL